MPTDNLLSLQHKFNNLGASKLGDRERNSAVTDRFGTSDWGAQRPNQFMNPRNTAQPGGQQFKKRSNSNIGKGSGLASTRRNPLSASALTPQGYRRPIDASIDDA